MCGCYAAGATQMEMRCGDFWAGIFLTAGRAEMHVRERGPADARMCVRL